MKSIRNIAIIAHVDHGKTTLVDHILKQCKLFRDNQEVRDCFLDSNDLERERGITILAKNISVRYKQVKINIIDTPGHSDFGGQVERVLKLADGVLLLVDAAEGPMPQTRFVLDKALRLNLHPIVVINKLDKPDARPEKVHDKILELFFDLDASDKQLEFPTLYASGRNGWVDYDLTGPRNSIFPLLDTIIERIPPPAIISGTVQLQIATLDYSDYIGRIGIGRIYRGSLNLTQGICVIKRDGSQKLAQIKQLFTFEGLERKEQHCVPCGDLCGVAGIPDIDIGDTISDLEHPEALDYIAVDEPTISMFFSINDSPIYGKEGKYVSSRHLRERLFKEQEKDVALQVKEVEGDKFEVRGRGVLHLAILIENMRRDGYELTVSQPHVIYKMLNGERQEPFEILAVDIPSDYAGKAIELVGMRKGEMLRMESRGSRQILEFNIPTRGLIGLRSKLLTATAGEAVISHRFTHYDKEKGIIPQRTNGVLISMSAGKASAYAIDALQLRGTFFLAPNDITYEGMIVGEHCKEGDLVVNLQKTKKLTNIRAAGSDRALKIVPPRRMSLEEALEFIKDDELVEATPCSVRLRKRYLTELERRRRRPKS